jgi:diguanylate cyclase (GGDEF)-like protein
VVDPPTPPEPSSPARAVAAVERLLVADDPERAMVREALELLDADRAVLLSAPAASRPARILAQEPPSSGRALDAIDLPLRSTRPQRGRAPLRLEGAEAARLAAALGSSTIPAVVALVPLGRPEVAGPILVLLSADPMGLGADELELARSFGRVAAAILGQQSVISDQAGPVSREATLAAAGRAINESLDPTDTLDRICVEAMAIGQADHAVVWLGNGLDGVYAEAAAGLPPEFLGSYLAPGRGLAGRVAEHDRPMLSNIPVRTGGLPPHHLLESTRSLLAAPLRWDGELRGVVAVGYDAEGEASGDRLKLLEAFADLADLAIRNAAAHAGLAVAARTDALTGCLNHAALHESLAREIDRSTRTERGLSLVLLDLDDFKRVNEEHGHAVGDEVLRRVGHALRQALRPYDVVARYGGDEFAIIAVQAGELEAADIARRAIERVGAGLGELRDDALSVASAGVAEWTSGQTPGELLYAADLALLVGKHESRGGAIVLASDVPEDFRPGRFHRATAPTPTPVDPEVIDWITVSRDQTQRLRRRTRQLALASAVGARLAAMTAPQEIIHAAAEELHRAFGFHMCSVCRVRDDEVECVSGNGEPFVALEPGRWVQPRDVGIIGRCLREGRVILANDARSDPDFRTTERAGETRSELCAPLWVGDDLWGVINVEETRRDAFDEDDARALQTVADMVGSTLRTAMLFERLEGAYLGTAEALAAALEAKDSYTGEHARWIVELADRVGRRLGLGEPQRKLLRYGAALHDVGKIAVPEPILNKRGPLDPEERAVIEQHTVVGDQILAPVEFLHDVRPLVRHEHERWDGTGYPDGLAGQAIPLGARIIFACDAWRAMTSDRHYRAAMDAAAARDELRRNAGSQFDPLVVDVLLAELETGEPLGSPGGGPEGWQSGRMRRS